VAKALFLLSFARPSAPSGSAAARMAPNTYVLVDVVYSFQTPVWCGMRVGYSYYRWSRDAIT
jgi:hypothetical protein